MHIHTVKHCSVNVYDIYCTCNKCSYSYCVTALNSHLQMLGLRKRWNEDTTEAALRPRTHSALNSVSPQDAAIIAALRKEVEDLKSQIKQTKNSEVCNMGSCGMCYAHYCHMTVM